MKIKAIAQAELVGFNIRKSLAPPLSMFAFNLPISSITCRTILVADPYAAYRSDIYMVNINN